MWSWAALTIRSLWTTCSASWLHSSCMLSSNQLSHLKLLQLSCSVGGVRSLQPQVRRARTSMGILDLGQHRCGTPQHCLKANPEHPTLVGGKAAAPRKPHKERRGPSFECWQARVSVKPRTLKRACCSSSAREISKRSCAKQS